jgi:hypothetical protein
VPELRAIALYKQALAEYQREPIEVFRLGCLAAAYHAPGRKDESDAAFADLRRKYPDAKPFQTAEAPSFRGDIDGTFAMLEASARMNDIDVGAAAVYPTLAVLHDDPRWLPFLRKLGLAPEQLAAITFDVRASKY